MKKLILTFLTGLAFSSSAYAHDSYYYSDERYERYDHYERYERVLPPPPPPSPYGHGYVRYERYERVPVRRVPVRRERMSLGTAAAIVGGVIIINTISD